MSSLRTLVVGGAGFIGQSLVRCLLADAQRQVWVLGRSAQPGFALPPEVRYIQGDASDTASMTMLLDEVDEVVDLAYATVPKTSFDDPLFDVVSNLPASVNLQLTASRKPLKRYLLVSSGGTVYGQQQMLTINERHPTNPISPYGISKLVTEKYANFFHQMDSLPVIIVRPSNPYGLRQIGKTTQGFIGASTAALRENRPITVFGERGTVRDYIDILDLSSGLKAALNHGHIGSTYNIGTGVGTDNLGVLELLQQLAERDGIKMRVTHLPERRFDVLTNVLDSSLLSEHTGWHPQTTLNQGLQRVWDQSRSIQPTTQAATT